MASQRIATLCSAAILASQAATAHAAITQTQLAGNPLSRFPFFEYVKAINVNAPVTVAIDPTRFGGIVGKTCEIYVVKAKSAAQWAADASLTDETGRTRISIEDFAVAVIDEVETHQHPRQRVTFAY